eukprot:TRINITY_DN5970_c0_g1_i1.p2 TRINITY_DN5970_c0_g1~~TRINITY_DN5970_c0_g1_i1.p2  ORF type:complete len:218 (+),score=23.19 TRINITY_DN5970_c0_g1_i1:870-1523(+)
MCVADARRLGFAVCPNHLFRARSGATIVVVAAATFIVLVGLLQGPTSVVYCDLQYSGDVFFVGFGGQVYAYDPATGGKLFDTSWTLPPPQTVSAIAVDSKIRRAFVLSRDPVKNFTFVTYLTVEGGLQNSYEVSAQGFDGGYTAAGITHTQNMPVGPGGPGMLVVSDAANKQMWLSNDFLFLQFAQLGAPLTDVALKETSQRECVVDWFCCVVMDIT